MPATLEFGEVLRKCATDEAYRETCRLATGGREFDPSSLERLWRELRTNRNTYLLRSDLGRIFEEGKTVYGHYWRLSGLKEWGDTDISLHESHCGVPGWKEGIVQQLLSRLFRMEIVSVILSRVYPEDFAVYSPPIMTILQLKPLPPIQHYLDYCAELREWGHYFLGSEHVSTADRALWVFYQQAYSPNSDVKTQLLYRNAYNDDYWIRQRHASATLGPYFSKYPPLKQAKFLLEIDLYLAATIAGCEFEARIRDLIPATMRSRLAGDLYSMVEYVVRHSGSTSKRERFHELRKWRNLAVHREPGLTPQLVREMIGQIELIPKRNSA
jgi:hypothetical protein